MPKAEKKDEDEDDYIPFQNVEKGVLLQEKRLFNETNLNPRKCCVLLTKVLYLLVQGETFTTNEATDLFFAVTKLFQSKDIVLRRMVYQVLKELAPLAIPENVIIVISSLTKDVNTNTELYRANAIRVLCKIIPDASLLGQGERYLKQAIVDKEPYVASAALVSGVHLMQKSSFQDLVKRWFSEIQEASKKKAPMVQYHALGLLHQLRQHDRLAVSKLVNSLASGPIRSPYAHCLLIRYAAQVIEEDPDATSKERGLYEYLESCLRNKSDIVEFEAARAFCFMKNVNPRELASSIAVLQQFLGSSKPTQRFAAIRTLNKVAITYRTQVMTCNSDMEILISDSNRSVATLAITTLLKTGSETGIDRLMKQISNFMTEISDEFKIVVVDAIRSLCSKYPEKARSLLGFLSNILREEGGFDYKKSIVDTILSIFNDLPATKETGLSHLCEFIEDCEYTYLSTKILHVLGEEGPATSSPNKYIRYIYNRVILENPQVRAAAVTALAKFAVQCDQLRTSISILLRRCLTDGDDEVRDRATLYLRLMEKDIDYAKEIILNTAMKPSLWSIESALLDIRRNPQKPVDFSSFITGWERSHGLELTKEGPVGGVSAGPTPGSGPAASAAHKDSGASTTTEKTSAPVNPVKQFPPQLAHLGAPFKSSAKPVELTEPETEYVVNCIKHTFPNHILFQFNCTNTLNDMLLEKVTVKMEAESNEEDGLVLKEVFPIDRLSPNSPASVFVLATFQPNTFPLANFSNTLKFLQTSIDPSTGEPDSHPYDDDYSLDHVEVTTSDYMQKAYISNFQQHWDELEHEDKEIFTLSSIKSIQDAVVEIPEYLGMQPCERSENITADKTKHVLYLAGKFLGGARVLARARLKLEPSEGVKMELCVRSNDPNISSLIANNTF
jgi:coatomer protein complex subunit gamma